MIFHRLELLSRILFWYLWPQVTHHLLQESILCHSVFQYYLCDDTQRNINVWMASNSKWIEMSWEATWGFANERRWGATTGHCLHPILMRYWEALGLDGQQWPVHLQCWLPVGSMASPTSVHAAAFDQRLLSLFVQLDSYETEKHFSKPNYMATNQLFPLLLNWSWKNFKGQLQMHKWHFLCIVKMSLRTSTRELILFFLYPNDNSSLGLRVFYNVQSWL